MNIRSLLMSLCALAIAAPFALAQAPAPAPTPQAAPQAAPEKRTVTNTLERALSNVEKEFVDAADAMPEEKYSFAPTSGEFKGVRTFGEQVRHVATTNYLFGAAMLGEKSPVEEGDKENGSPAIKSKADIMKYLRDSFAYVHKAFAATNEQNLVETFDAFGGKGNATRLGLATLTVGHSFDHYGQMVEYLRMNNIVPPASRKQ